MDVHLHQRKNPATRLLKLMRPLQERYACLILDCAPGMSLVSENVMHAADALVVPLLPSPLSVRTLEQLFEFVERKSWTDLKVLPFFSMVDRRKSLHRETIDSLRGPFPDDPRRPKFRTAATSRGSTLRRAPVESYAPGERGGRGLSGAMARDRRPAAERRRPARGQAAKSSRRDRTRRRSDRGRARSSEFQLDLELVEIELRERGLVAAHEILERRVDFLREIATSSSILRGTDCRPGAFMATAFLIRDGFEPTPMGRAADVNAVTQSVDRGVIRR